MIALTAIANAQYTTRLIFSPTRCNPRFREIVEQGAGRKSNGFGERLNLYPGWKDTVASEALNAAREPSTLLTTEAYALALQIRAMRDSGEQRQSFLYIEFR